MSMGVQAGKCGMFGILEEIQADCHVEDYRAWREIK